MTLYRYWRVGACFLCGLLVGVALFNSCNLATGTVEPSDFMDTVILPLHRN